MKATHWILLTIASAVFARRPHFHAQNTGTKIINNLEEENLEDFCSQDISKKNLLGRGSFGEVRDLGEHVSKDFGSKGFNNAKLKLEQAQAEYDIELKKLLSSTVQAEVACHKSIPGHCDHVAKLEFVCSKHPRLIYEKVGFSLEAYVKKLPHDTHFGCRIAKLHLDFAKGLECIHNAGQPHADIKPDNLRVSSGGTGKLIDFGLCDSSNHVQVHGSTNGFFNTTQVYGHARTTHDTDVGLLALTMMVVSSSQALTGMTVLDDAILYLKLATNTQNEEAIRAFVGKVFNHDAHLRLLENIVKASLGMAGEAVHRPTASELVRQLETLLVTDCQT